MFNVHQLKVLNVLESIYQQFIAEFIDNGDGSQCVRVCVLRWDGPQCDD